MDDSVSSSRGGAAMSVPRSLITRIKLRMKELGTNAAKVSKEARLGTTAVHDILSGKNENPSVGVVKAIAESLQCDLSYLVGDQAHPRQLVEVQSKSIPIIGIVEAGAFREMPKSAVSEHELRLVSAPQSENYPHAKHFAFEVRGNSMNASRPTPLLEGMLVLCVDMVDAEIEVESGKIYVVRRTTDGGQTYEFTLKRAKLFKDRIELRAESTATYAPIRLSRSFDPDIEGTEVVAIGLVYGIFRSIED